MLGLIGSGAAMVARANDDKVDSALGGEGRWWPHMESMHGWSMAWWHGLGGLLVLALLIGLAVVVAALLIRVVSRGYGDLEWGRRSGVRPDRRDPTHSALQILGERFARGEIDQKEFEERRSALQSSRTSN